MYTIDFSDAHDDWNRLMMIVDEIERLTDSFVEFGKAHIHFSWNYSPKKFIYVGGQTKWREKRNLFDSAGGKHFHRTVYFGKNKNAPQVDSKKLAVWYTCILFVQWFNDKKVKLDVI